MDCLCVGQPHHLTRYLQYRLLIINPFGRHPLTTFTCLFPPFFRISSTSLLLALGQYPSHIRLSDIFESVEV